jgi:hypothetical protein
MGQIYGLIKPFLKSKWPEKLILCYRKWNVAAIDDPLNIFLYVTLFNIVFQCDANRKINFWSFQLFQ